MTHSRKARFLAMLGRWSERVGVKPGQVRFQRMTRKWASCSTARRRISFSLDLLNRPRDFQEYVIVHELLHLQVPNHGRLHKSMLRAFLADKGSQYDGGLPER